MDNLPVAALLSQSIARREITSALPDAPVVDDSPRERRPHAVRSRAALSRVLQRAAVAVAPQQCRQPATYRP